MQYLRQGIIVLYLCFFWGMGSSQLFAQTDEGDSLTIEIVEIMPDEARKRLVVEISARSSFGVLSDELINGTTLEFTETMGDTSAVNAFGANPFVLGPENFAQTEEGTYLIRLSSPSNFPEPRKVYKGQNRTLTVRWEPENMLVSQTFSIGTPSNPVNFKEVLWREVILIGMIIVTGLLVLLSQLLSGFTRLQFNRKYVQKYQDIKEAGRRRMDPITGDPFEDDEMIVTRCEQWHSVDSWEYNHFQCVNYPDCQNRAVPCTDGESLQTESYQFFTQQGSFKNLNWLWFGSLGGLISWGIWALLTNFALGPYRALMGNLVSGAEYQVARDSLMGFSLGLGLVFALAWVEERGQSSNFSWLRVILKSLIGAVLSMLVFLGAFLLYYSIGLQNDYFGGIISWGLFGIFLGVILSVRSTIELTRGILGGLIAGIVAFNIFFGLSLIFDAFELAKMIAFVVLGGVLGIIVVAVVSQLEDFELEYISPQKYSRVNPISKWLKANMDIFIGSDSSCYVFVKWPDDEVQPKHAKLSYDGNAVYLEPYAETLIGNRILPLNKPYELQNGDIIRLGRTSVSRMKFIAKSSSE